MLYKFKNKFIKAVDGDTIDVMVDLGFKVCIEQRFRLARINAPENDPKSTEFVEQFFQKYGPTCHIETAGKDKYGRYIAEVTLVSGPVMINLSDDLLASGLVQTYQGGETR